MVRKSGSFSESHAKARGQAVAEVPDDATPKQLANRRKAQEKKEADLQKTKIKALEKEVKLLVQSIRLKFREHTVEERITRDKEKYSRYGSYVRNVGVPGVYGEGGAEKYSGYKPKGGAKPLGGPMRMVNGVPVGGLGSAMGAGVAAGGILLLTAAIYKMIANSKIVNMVNSSINKALGLILDLILLPFIPLLTWAIINLFKGIMEWNKAYQANPIQTLVDTILGLITILSPGGVFLLFGETIGKSIGQLIIDNIITPTLAGLTDWWEGFVSVWNAFWSDPLATVKTAWALFVIDIKTKLSDAFAGFVNYLLSLPVIGDALRAAGVGHANLSIPPLTESEWKGVYANRTPSSGASGGASGSDLGSKHPSEVREVPSWVIQVQADKWVDPDKVQADIQRMVDQMMWVLRQTNQIV